MPAGTEEIIMYNEKKTDVERFNEIEEKALEKRSHYDYIHISPEAGMASIQQYGRFRIKNAFVFTQSGSTWREWEVSDYRLLKSSDTFSFCAKNLWNIAVCAGKKENDSSYFFFKDMDAKAPIDFFAIGALEMEECALAFCFDWKKKKNQYLVVERAQTEDSDLFYIMRTMKELAKRKGIAYGTTQTQIEWPIQRD